MSSTHQEKAFQKLIADHLESQGWLRSDNSAGYDVERALFPEDLLGWLEDSDPENFARIVPPDGDEAAKERGRRRILDRVVKQLSTSESNGGGTLRTLRGKLRLPGARDFALLQFPPADERNPELIRRYQFNRLRVVREVRYSTKSSASLDFVLFVNGLPVATIELKSEMTQALEAAKQQYKKDRRPKGEPLLIDGRGALVHFAVSEEEVAMTTRLAGDSTTFLPFNRGHNNGEGNPPIDGNAPAAYFWEEVLAPDTWLHILTKFIYINHERHTDPTTGEVTDKTQIRFPRYHQWRAVTNLTRAARDEGPGNNYLVQHSAGSGKTDSIAWTAHRLASLHTAAGEKVFDNVLVISDRQVLDRQLQDAIDQLTTTMGTFQPITSGSDGSKTDQVLEALAADTPIIGLTLQTFPFALQKIRDEGGRIAGRRFAVIADEAHSSQTGEASSALKELLYTNAEDSVSGAEEDAAGQDQDVLNRMAAQVDADDRISFFAFTATPKAKTLEMFGRRDQAGELEPFDLYSMKQAIDEGFILDVLKNYTSYDVAARIANRAEQERGESGEEVDVRRGARALIAHVELHPTNVASKVHEIIEHYQRVVRPELGGKAKAMVVTSSRAAAVQYHRAFEREVERRQLDLQSLVAFSGTVPDPDVEVLNEGDRPEVTEASANPGLYGRDLASVFAQDGQHVLIVANKYQTGFDQPLLTAMYVDKKLSGISAVQTLSRLNRRAPGKDNTYVLDFVNDPEQIRDAFLEYYEDAHVETESDPELISDLRTKLENENIFTQSEVDLFWREWRSTSERRNAVYASLRPAKERFAHRWHQAVLGPEPDTHAMERLVEFRSTLTQYPKAYAFFSQILDYGDPFYEKLSPFAGLLAELLKNFTADETDPAAVDISEVVLTHYKLEKLREEDLQLHSGEAEGLQGLTEAGMSRQAEKERAAMTAVIEKVNKYLGDLEASDEYKVGSLRLLANQVASHSTLQQQYRNNSTQDFLYSPVLVEVSEDALWTHENNTDEIVKRLRELPDAERIRLLVEVGLLDALKESSRAG